MSISLDDSEFVNDPKFNSFVEEQVQKQRFQNLVGSLTDKCWDLCIDKPSPRLESRTESCLVSCVERFLDSTHFVLNRFEKTSKSLESSNYETLIEKMFAGIKNFVYRHRRKLIISGVVVGGFVFATRYAQRKLREWQEREMKEFLDRTQRQQHFEKNERTCNQTILSLSPTLCDTIGKLLDTDALLEKLRSGSCDKVATWEELKILAFTRLSVLLYSGTLLVILLRIQVNLIGGYLYRQHNSEMPANEKCDISKQLQEEYLSLCQHFLTKGVKDLCTLIESKVRFVLEGESLKKQLSLQDIEHYFWAIQSAINTDPDDPLAYLSKFILPPARAYDFKGNEGKLMCQIVNETLDIIETNEVKSLATSCINRGFAQIMDRISEFFVPDNLKNQLAIPGPSSRIDDSPKNHLQNGLISINKVTMPMAKVVPIVNGLTTVAKAGGSKDACELWIQQFINLHNLKTLGANIYESFSNSC